MSRVLRWRRRLRGWGKHYCISYILLSGSLGVDGLGLGVFGSLLVAQYRQFRSVAHCGLDRNGVVNESLGVERLRAVQPLSARRPPPPPTFRRPSSSGR